MCLSVRGALNMPKSKLRGWIRHDSGRLMTPDEARHALMDELAKGHEVIPMGEPCEGFDYTKGCPGHPDESPDKPNETQSRATDATP